MNSFSQTSVLTSFFDADSDLENLAPHPKKDQKESSMSSLRFTIHSIQLIKPLPKTRLGCGIQKIGMRHTKDWDAAYTPIFFS